MAKVDAIRGVIQKIHSDGRHGPYAIATVEGLGSVTFSLEKRVWDEEDKPEPGEIVMLSKLREKRAGWRAMQARYATPSDNRQSGKLSNQQRSNTQ
jgi:hypothetical protein